MLNLNDIVDIHFSGIDPRDAPEYSDAYISEAYWSNGSELTDEEYEEINTQYPQWLYEKLINFLY